MSSSSEWAPSLWMETFDELDYGDQWRLNFNYTQTDTVTNEERKRGWKIYCNWAYGNFECRTCDNTWASARVGVLFRYRLRGDRGTVIMRPYRQACRSCQDDEFYFPGFSKKEAEEVLLRLFRKIRKNCYGDDDDDDRGSSTGSDKRKTKPHESSLCEACIQGICSQNDD